MKSHFLILSFALLNLSGFSATIYVPDDYATIQGAIDAAVRHDVIIVRAGTYFENIDFAGKAVTVRSEEGPEVTTIDGSQAGSVVVFRNGEGSDSILAGFTITNGTGTLKPSFGRYYGGGILCYQSSPLIMRNRIVDNTVDYGGGGIVCLESRATIFENYISRNRSFSGGGIACFSSRTTISRNEITENRCSTGGGILCANDISRIFRNTIRGNECSGGGGICCNGICHTLISSNHILDNSGDLAGGGIEVECSGSPAIINNIIAGNTSLESSYSRGGGIAVLIGGSPIISQNTIYANQASRGGGISCEKDSTADVSNTILWDNVAPTGPEIMVADDWAWGPACVAIKYSDVKGGQSSIYVDPESTLHWGHGMIDADPLFVDASERDFHLTLKSPCVNTGFGYAYHRDYDFEGDPQGGKRDDMGADEFYYHLYHTGDAVPGATITVNILGYHKAPVLLAWGQKILDPPLITQHGNLHIWPFAWCRFVGNIPPNGVLSIPVPLSSTWNPGDHAPLQALIGPWGNWRWTELTNLDDITVE